MIRAALMRLGQGVCVLVGISILVFAVFFATPGADPTSRIAGRGASPAVLARVRHDYAFDKPLPAQYVRMMAKLFIQRDLTSFVDHGERVVPEVFAAAPVTLSLVGGAAVLWVLAAIGMGVASALWPGGMLDRVLMGLSVLLLSIPVFWLGEVVNLFTQGRTHGFWLFSWVPPLGYVPLTTDPVAWARALVLPWCVLASSFAGLYARVLRAELLAAQAEDYMRTARAKGLSPLRAIMAHALRMSWLGFVSLFGLDVAQLIGGGALLTEVVFALPGVGHLTFRGLQSLDLPLIMATVLYSAAFVVCANALVDLVYLALDPRLRGRARDA